MKSPEQHYEEDASDVPILYTRKLRLREKGRAQGYILNWGQPLKWRKWDVGGLGKLGKTGIAH